MESCFKKISALKVCMTEQLVCLGCLTRDGVEWYYNPVKKQFYARKFHDNLTMTPMSFDNAHIFKRRMILKKLDEKGLSDHKPFETDPIVFFGCRFRNGSQLEFDTVKKQLYLYNLNESVRTPTTLDELEIDENTKREIIRKMEENGLVERMTYTAP